MKVLASRLTSIVYRYSCTLVFFPFFSLIVCSGYFTSSLSLPLWKQELHQEPPQKSPLTAFYFPPSPASPASVSDNSRLVCFPTVSILHVCIVFTGKQCCCCCCYCCRLWFMGFTPLFELFVLFLQANSVMTEYSTSIAQKIIYIFACLGKHSKSKWQNSTTSINVDMENFKHELYDKHNAKGLKSHAHPQPAQSQPSCWWPTSSWRSQTYPCRTIWWVGSSAEFL